jgi:peptide/nickel transport system substrate-binding protein
LSTKEPWKRGVEHAPMMDIRYMTLNNEIAPFTDKRVRQAFNHAINRARITGFLTGRATLAKGPIPPNLPAADPTLKGYDYDPKRAEALLKEANFRDTPNAPIPLLYATNEPWYGKAAQSIQADLKAVGVSVKIVPLRYGDLKAQAGRRGPSGARMALMGWLQDYPDASNYLDPLFNSRSIAKVSSLNRSFYSNPRVNTLLDEALGERDIPKRERMYREAQRIIVDDAPVVFLHHTERYVIRQPWVKGPILHPAWSVVYEQLSVD